MLIHAMDFNRYFFGVVCCLCLIYSVSCDDACQDKVACNIYPPTMCTDPQYISWKMVNCPQYCGMCKQATPSHIGVGRYMDSDNNGPTCTDTYPDCSQYGTKICDDVKFYNWVNENCKKHCNRCSNDCKDVITNCAEYGSEVCTELSYYNWVEMHCRKFCGRCQS
ncbi:hypothetical protein ACF0H5_023451 [Mactra antiquata]